MVRMNRDYTCSICNSDLKHTDAVNELTKEKDTYVCIKCSNLNFR